MSRWVGRRGTVGTMMAVAGLLALSACTSSSDADKAAASGAPPERHAVFFEPDSAELDQLARDVIARIADNHRASRARAITLEAFANRTDAGTENRPLAERRADVIRRALEARGVDPRIVATVVVGQAQRIGLSALEGRRVDITLER